MLAGIVNGSFIIPAKYIMQWSNARIWLYHSMVGILLIPWLILLLTTPFIIPHLFALSPAILLLIVGSGFIFGIGQCCFAYAIQYAGIAISFAINLALGVFIGSFYVVIFKHALFTWQGMLVNLALILILLALWMRYHAEQHSDTNKYKLGWILAIITGCTSGLQNITFITTLAHTTSQLKLVPAFWVWPLFLLAASISMIVGFYKLIYQTKESIQYSKLSIKNTLRNFALVFIMGLCFTGSLYLYSTALDHHNTTNKLIGWPTFMVAIILTTQAWDFFYQTPSAKSVRKSAYYKCFSIILLISAVIILGLES